MPEVFHNLKIGQVARMSGADCNPSTLKVDTAGAQVIGLKKLLLVLQDQDQLILRVHFSCLVIMAPF